MTQKIKQTPKKASQKSLWPRWNEDTRDTRRDYAVSVAGGLAITVVFHLAIIMSIPWDRIQTVFVEPPEPEPPMEVEFVQLPDYVQTNPEAEMTPPEETANISERDQRAAQEVPDELNDSDRPAVQGEMDSENIVEGAPLEPTPPPLPEGQQAPDQQALQPEQATEPTPEVQEQAQEQPEVEPSSVPETVEPDLEQQEVAPEALEQEAVQEAGELSLEDMGEQPVEDVPEKPVEEQAMPKPIEAPEAEKVVEKTTPPENPKVVMQEVAPQQASKSGATPKPRPVLNYRVASGPIMQNNRGASRVGSVAIDAQYSQFGAYIARMREAIQQQWYLLATQARYTGADINTNCIVEFTLDQKGQITGIQVLHTSASQKGTIITVESIKSRAPYGDWTPDMKQVIGDTWTLRINFFYR